MANLCGRMKAALDRNGITLDDEQDEGNNHREDGNDN